MRKSLKIKKIGFSVLPCNHTKFLRLFNSFQEKIIVIKCSYDKSHRGISMWHYDCVYVACVDVFVLEKYAGVYIPDF